MKTKTAFAICAHPDDIEFMMSGTLLLLKDAGYEIHYMNLANGALGSMYMNNEMTARARRAESQASCELCGAVYHDSIAEDLSLFYDARTLAALVPVVREVAPEIILTHGPYDYMEDHINACRLAVSAAFCRRMPNFRLNDECPVTDQPLAIYHSMPHSITDQLRRPVRADMFVDIAAKMQLKEKMLSCHATQKDWLDSTQGEGSYISGMVSAARHFGKESGAFEFAEGWIRHNSVGFADESFNPLVEALEDKVKFADG